MWKTTVLVFVVLLPEYLCYKQNPHKKNNIDFKRKSLQKNIEIYESIKECNVSDITTCGEICNECSGSGIVLCNYCHGTGFLTMGDVLIGTNNKCTICNGTGEIKCKKCMGAGYISKWRSK